MAAALVPMSAVFWAVVSRGVYAVTLELYDRRLGDAVIEDPPREGGWKQGHV